MSKKSLLLFAKLRPRLDISPSFLSKLLNGQRRITDEVFRKLTTNLNLESEHIRIFAEASSANAAGTEFNPLQMEYFKIISDWYHYAIIELCNTEGFKNSPDWIARRLGITVHQVKAAIERLLSLDLLKEEEGRLVPTSGGNTTMKNEFTAFAFKKMQAELLNKALDSLWNEDISLRDHTSICMAIDPEDIPEVKKRLTQARREICQFLERPRQGKPREVYNLSLSFFFTYQGAVMKRLFVLTVVAVHLISCQGGGGNSASPGIGPDPINPKPAPEESTNNESSPGNSSGSSNWRADFLGQEGHGGDAIVCFNIPISRAVISGELVTPKSETICYPNGQCETKIPVERVSPINPIVWRITDEGRRSIRSAKPLEQFLAEKISSKKLIVDELNRMSVEDGYLKITSAFRELPAVKESIRQQHQKLGWLLQEGIGSDYGLMDIKDSGFVSENEIDTRYCKELQAVVRRDNQLWYDRDIIAHFDNAGKVLMQMHEEIYAWAKTRDTINEKIGGAPMHRTSERTRGLILKLMDKEIDVERSGQHLKDLGFSVGYWYDSYNFPLSPGSFMNKDICEQEQNYLRGALSYNGGSGERHQIYVTSIFAERYLRADHVTMLELKANLPARLAEMIDYSFLYQGSWGRFGEGLDQLSQKFFDPQACQ